MNYKKKLDCGLSIVFNGRYMGVIDTKGNTVIPTTYDTVVFIPSKPVFLVKRKKKYGIIALDGTKICPCKYDHISTSTNAEHISDGYEICGNDGIGWLSESGKEVIPPICKEYDALGNWYIGEESRRYNTIVFDQNGKQITQKKHFQIKNAGDGYFFAEQINYTSSKDYWALFSPKGKQLTEYIIGRFGKYTEGYVPVTLTTDSIDVIIPYDKDNADAGSIRATMKNPEAMWCFLDQQGNRLGTELYDEVNYFSEGLAVVKKDDKYGFINTSGEIAIPLKYTMCLSMQNGYAQVFIGEESQIINHQGDLVITSPENKFFSPVNKDGISQCCFMDNTLGYTDLTHFYHYEYDPAQGHYLMRDNKGNPAPIPQLSSLRPYVDGTLNVCENGRYGMLDEAGKIIIPIEYEDVSTSFWGDLAFVKKNGKYAFLHRDGHLLTGYDYDKAGFLTRGYGIGQQWNKDNKPCYALISAHGAVSDCIYPHIGAYNSRHSKYNDEYGTREYPVGGEWLYGIGLGELQLHDLLNNQIITTNINDTEIIPPNYLVPEPHFEISFRQYIGLNAQELPVVSEQDPLYNGTLPPPLFLRQPPAIIQQSKVTTAKNKFANGWGCCTDAYYLHNYHSKTYDEVSGFPLRFSCALTAAVSEWVLWRIAATCQQYFNYEYAFWRLDALYAGSVHPGYVKGYLDCSIGICEKKVEHFNDLDEKTQQEIGALDELLLCWDWFFRSYSNLDYNAYCRTVYVIVLARKMLSGNTKKAFNNWLENILQKARIYYCNDADLREIKNDTKGCYNFYLDSVVPREFFWNEDYTPSLVTDEAHVAAFLDHLPWHESPYLDNNIYTDRPFFHFKKAAE